MRKHFDYSENGLKERFREKFGDKFDEYVISRNSENGKLMVEFLCPHHGYQTKTVWKFLDSKYGCNACYLQSIRINSILRFKNKFEDKFGDKFIYHWDEYEGPDKPLKITCPEHGTFMQHPSNHTRGPYGCRGCYYDDRKKNKALKYTTEQFVEKCIKIYGDKYDYDLTEYKGIKDKIVVSCKEHGPFTCIADSHAQGLSHCPTCRAEDSGKIYFNRFENASIYLFKLSNENEQFLKVGITQNVRDRVNQIRTESGYNIEVIREVKDYSRRVWLFETRIHQSPLLNSYKPKKYFGGITECYSLCDFTVLNKWLDKFGGSLGKGKENAKFWSRFD